MYCAALIAVTSIVLSCNSSHQDSKSLNKVVRKLDLEMAEVPTNSGIAENFAITADQISDSTAGQILPTGPGNQKQLPHSSSQTIDWDKKIIKNASINAEVKDYKAFYSSLHEKVKSVGGYIAQEEQNQSDYKIENTLVIKVPVDQFDNALVQLSANTEKINEKKITSEDVTTEVFDTKSRMEAKRQVRSRYLDLLKQSKNMDDILKVQNEINGIQEEIESGTGRVQYLTHASAYSTINLTYYQVLNISAKDKDNPGFGTELARSFRVGGEWIKDLFIGVVSVWPLLLLVAFIIVLYKRSKVRKVTTDINQQATS
jgi:hypothetical protein